MMIAPQAAILFEPQNMLFCNRGMASVMREKKDVRQVWKKNQKSASSVFPGSGFGYFHSKDPMPENITVAHIMKDVQSIESCLVTKRPICSAILGHERVLRANTRLDLADSRLWNISSSTVYLSPIKLFCSLLSRFRSIAASSCLFRGWRAASRCSNWGLRYRLE